MAYTLDISLALGGTKTGLTLAAQLVGTTGADVGSEVTTGFTEIGNGNYLWHYAAFPDGHRGGVKFYEDGIPGTILAFCAVNPEEAENTNAKVSAIDTVLSGSHGEGNWEGAADWTGDEKAQIRDALGVEGEAADAAGGQLQAIKARTDLIGSAGVEFAGSVNADGTLDLVAGDDYLEANGKELIWRVDDWAGPNLAGATAVLAFVRMEDWQAGTIEAELTATAMAEMQDGTALFTGELTAAQTGALETSPPEHYYNYVYQLRVTTAATHRLTIAGNGVHVEPGA